MYIFKVYFTKKFLHFEAAPLYVLDLKHKFNRIEVGLKLHQDILKFIFNQNMISDKIVVRPDIPVFWYVKSNKNRYLIKRYKLYMKLYI